MSAKPKFAHVVYQTAQPQEMRDWYCTVLDGHVVYTDEALSFVTFDDEHHRGRTSTPADPRRAGASVEELSDRKWALQTERPPAIAVLLGAG
jgi:catechol-2,3-dioxygenase